MSQINIRFNCHIDQSEAPDGYYAELKSLLNSGDNICRSCDWRPECQRNDTDFSLHNHRCMDFPVITLDGREVARNDGCSVIFKRSAAKDSLTAQMRKAAQPTKGE